MTSSAEQRFRTQFPKNIAPSRSAHRRFTPKSADSMRREGSHAPARQLPAAGPGSIPGRATDTTACGCAGSHGRLRICKTGFDSSARFDLTVSTLGLCNRGWGRSILRCTGTGMPWPLKSAVGNVCTSGISDHRPSEHRASRMDREFDTRRVRSSSVWCTYGITRRRSGVIFLDEQGWVEIDELLAATKWAPAES